jgi:hypothetical protein
MNKKTVILGSVLLVLIALAFLYQGPLKNWQNNLGKPKNIIGEFDINKIDKFEIVSLNNTVTLTKQGAKWKINNTKDFYADPVIMSEAISSLKAAVQSDIELVSKVKERKVEFKTDISGLTVKIYQANKKVADFIIGDYAGINKTYVSLQDSNDTYLTQANLSGAFNQAEWRDLTIFSSDKQKVKNIRFQYPNREFTVEFKDGQWSGVIPEKFTVNQDKINLILEVMTNLKASRIPEQTFKDTGLDKHNIIVEASGDDINNTLMIGDSNGEFYYAKKGDSDNIYLIDKISRDKLNKTIFELK